MCLIHACEMVSAICSLKLGALFDRGHFIARITETFHGRMHGSEQEFQNHLNTFAMNSLIFQSFNMLSVSSVAMCPLLIVLCGTKIAYVELHLCMLSENCGIIMRWPEPPFAVIVNTHQGNSHGMLDLTRDETPLDY